MFYLHTQEKKIDVVRRTLRKVSESSCLAHSRKECEIALNTKRLRVTSHYEAYSITTTSDIYKWNRKFIALGELLQSSSS